MTERDQYFVRRVFTHLNRDIEFKWALTDSAQFGFATLLSDDPPRGRSLWSLSDLTIELVAALKTAHQLFVRLKYLGDASIIFFASLGDSSVCVLHDKLPYIRHTSGNRQPPSVSWRDIVPSPPESCTKREVNSYSHSTFHTRTEGLDTLVAYLLNQFLRGLGYGASFTKLREYVAIVTQSLER